MGRAYRKVTFTRPSVNTNNKFHTIGRRMLREMRTNGFKPFEVLSSGEMIFHDLPDARYQRDRTYWSRRNRSKYTPHQSEAEKERRATPNWYKARTRFLIRSASTD